jgi:Cys-tRNA(Pro) deacylase
MTPPDTPDTPDTPATRAVGASGLDHRVTVLDPPARSLEEAAEREGVPPEAKVKTLVVRRAEEDYVFVLVGGGRVIDWPKLRAHLGQSRLSMPDADDALRVTGYARGTITVLGSQRELPVVMDQALAGREISVGGGAHGVAIRVDADAFADHVGAEIVDVTKPG